MKLCRFDDNRLGVVSGDDVHDVTDVLAKLPAQHYPYPMFDALIASLPDLRGEIERLARNARAIPLAACKLLSPLANPGKIVAAPVNYQKHLQEVRKDANLHHGNMINEIERAGLFLKATSSLVGQSEGVRLVHADRRNDHEVELAVVIGRRAKNVSRETALSYVAGYCIGLDITIRGPEERSFRKSPDSYTVLGPWLVTADELPDPSALDLSIDVGGEARQRSNTSDLILDVPALIAFASSFYTLNPGDVLLTGTPEGVGSIQPGDTMKATIERIGTMQVAVTAA
ncbi:5-carboxymethyl-2-hydroxymuconate delta-isomerase [Caballeronia cordobensis]|uniref:5-carboxymethyl-2-hydroxymuconate delta-isomerase n=1 Tax=Caballeronia cordobensis TaxID=1353886 RepID=A0A158GTB1_CABCO|nr:fumarylacetoacetate hydrolase family protein [Caballeronia cordobensis]SAL35041.1 5-carboxymethyl-2-hydroxymuconate delta-isomerase [Caballeronia cordobensis]